VARGAALFDAGRHWDAHEAWEAGWLEASGDDRRFLQGLIQVAAGFHKLLVQGNRRGALRLWARALRRLEGIPEHWRGLKGAQLRVAVGQAMATLEAGGEVRSAPQVSYHPAPNGGTENG
jgi:predicted metal-dependent hydrolase